jgi:hypothetical protein
MNGATCPSCSSTHVRTLRPYRATNSDHTVRRRHCNDCTHRWYSIQPPEREISGVYLHWLRAHPTLGHCVELLQGALPQ